MAGVARFGIPAETARLFETVQTSLDQKRVQAAQQSLAGMTNAGVIWIVIALYRSTDDPECQERLLGVLQSARQESFAATLMSAADPLGVRLSDPLSCAILDALALIGSPTTVLYLIDRLNSAVHAGEDTMGLSAAIGRIMNPEALLILLSVSSGRTPYSTIEARIAATRALGSYEWREVGPTLSQILQAESDPRLLNAAQEAVNLAKGQNRR